MATEKGKVKSEIKRDFTSGGWIGSEKAVYLCKRMSLLYGNLF
jgi:hypothetical protein